MDMRWDDLKLFLAVHEQGSLSGAARKLKLGQPTLSRRIAELEEAVGEPLFERKNQGVSLTSAGQELLPSVQSMAEWANEAHISASKQTRLAEGKVRIAAPPGIAYEFVAPLAVKIRKKHPAIQIEVLSGIEILHLGRGETDISLRGQKPTDTDLVCVDEISSVMRVYASKTYSAQFNSRSSMQDLDWISWARPHDEFPISQKLNAKIPHFKPAFTSDDFNVLLAACKAGIGAMILPRMLHRFSGLREIQKLQELDIELGPDAVSSLYLVCHKRHRTLRKVQLVMDFISKEFDSLRTAS